MDITYEEGIKDNIIENNVATNRGGGIYIRNNSSPLITGNSIKNNSTAQYGVAGGIYVGSGIRPQPDWGNTDIPILTGDPAVLDPAADEEFFICGNSFYNNFHANFGSTVAYSEGAHVYFQK